MHILMDMITQNSHVHGQRQPLLMGTWGQPMCSRVSESVAWTVDSKLSSTELPGLSRTSRSPMPPCPLCSSRHGGWRQFFFSSWHGPVCIWSLQPHCQRLKRRDSGCHFSCNSLFTKYQGPHLDTASNRTFVDTAVSQTND